MKGLARSYCWWYGINKDIENLVSSCSNCQSQLTNPSKVEPHIWEPAVAPFERVHIDHAGPYMGHTFFLLIDAYSKWPEVHIVKNMLAETTILVCKKIFSVYGSPCILVSDNARTFVSSGFEKFLCEHGVYHRLPAPYHPATNAQAERFVQTIKKALAKIPAKSNIQYELQEILTQYRNMPHAQTGLSPAEMVFNRKIRGRLDLLKQTRVPKRKDCNIEKDSGTFKEGERVIARGYVGKSKWKFGIVEKRTGKLHYRVRTDCGQDWRRHKNQLRRTGVQLAMPVNEFDYYIPPEERIQILRTDENAPQAHEEQPDNVAADRAAKSAEAQDNMAEFVQLAAPPALQRRNPLRRRRRPETLHDYIVDVSLDEGENPVENLHSFNID
ncbi:uncharacterized protein K02A2.6-like [Agrilus planipennis]|uniref:RNA-directed DNA polymerase n=1 Tax=Agrilus planipennis TaxID=224129 RepID=A0A1W4XBB4_AGRPL|nr:uncharacterized protein K02A2.6-like [Agrilus planipennis]